MTSSPQQEIQMVCMGNALVDILAFVDDDFLKAQGITKGTHQLLSEAEISALYDLIPPARELSGGGGANTIAGLADLDVPCAFIGTVSDDAFGRIFQHDLRGCHVDFVCPTNTPKEGTGRCISLISPDGERTMRTYLGSSTEITRSGLSKLAFPKGRIFLTEAYLWHPQELREATMWAIQAARQSGMQVAITLSDVSCLQGARDTLLPFMREYVDIIVGNVHELQTLYNTPLDTAMTFARQHFTSAALTNGKNGSILLHKGDMCEVERYPATTVVDTTGAGDIYASGFFYGLLNGLPLPEIGRIASRLASEIITHVGSRPEKKLSRLL